tara:strand:+ start:185 stop:1147 length:963 start_codon:yes stop_codon:yes gene_type:complete
MKYEKYQHLLAKTLNKGIFQHDFPYEVRIETVNACNSTCSFCPMNIYSVETKNRKVVRMDENLYDKIIKELHDEDFSGDLKFYTENEPLLDRRLTDFVKNAKKHVPKAKRMQVDTNGLLLTEELGANLIEAGINHLHINDYSKDQKGGVNHRKEKIKSIFDKLVVRFPKTKLVHRFRLLEEVLDSRGGHAPNNPLVLNNSPKVSCAFPFYQFPITSNGNIGLCCVDTVFEEPLGNINDNSIKEIWRSKSYKNFRNDLTSGKRNKKLCSQCTFEGHSPDMRFKTKNGKSGSPLYGLLSYPIVVKSKFNSIFGKTTSPESPD